MSALLRLLESDRVTPFASFSFGNILAGRVSLPKLLFMHSHGTSNCDSSEFGIGQVAGNDGFQFAEISEGLLISLSAFNFTQSVVEAGGSIPLGADIAYKITVLDSWNFETEMSVVSVAPAISIDNARVVLGWGAIAGAHKYRVYSNISAGGYFLAGETVTNSFVDLTGQNNAATVPPAIGSVAYRFETWGSSSINAGTLTPGTRKAVALRQNIPSHMTPAGNPRQHTIFVSFLSV